MADVALAARSSRRYTEDEITTLSPVELVVKVLDGAVAACDRKDRQRASRCVVTLISALNFDYREMAAALYRLYEYSLSCVRRGDFAAAREVLHGLREAWAQAAAQPVSTGE